MTVPLPILRNGSCEPFKAAVHGVSMGLCALMGLYNAAAWLNRREPHLALNAVFYGLAVAIEQRHVRHHLASCRDATPNPAVPICVADSLRELPDEEAGVDVAA